MEPSPLTSEKPAKEANLLSKEETLAIEAVDSKEIRDTPSETPLILFCEIHKVPYTYFQLNETEDAYECEHCSIEEGQ